MFVPYYDEFCVYLTQDDIINFIEDKFNENENIKKEELYEICVNYFGINYDSVILEILDF
jgi:hypothetical protein